MKRVVLTAAILMTSIGLKAQDCDVLLLPYFQNDKALLEEAKSVTPEKMAYRCAFARAAFYESDSVPSGVDVFSITEVKSIATGEYLPQDYIVDLGSFSYYAYNFFDFRRRYPDGGYQVCFSTPSSKHPYLVMRSIGEMQAAAESVLKK